MNNNNGLILKEALKLFKLNVLAVSSHEIGNSANLIYDLQANEESYILRISNEPFNKLEQYEAEMDYVNYLSEMNANVSHVIPSVNNRLVEVINTHDNCHFVSLFQKAKGHLPKLDNPSEWNAVLFYRWGKTMGKFHTLTKDYHPTKSVFKRKQWCEEFNLKKEAILYSVWKQLIDVMNTFPKDQDSYGLIHNDFHHYNFYIFEDYLTVFDFDDCLYHWYAYDIAIALYHALQTIPFSKTKERIAFGINFIKNFLKGYLEENTLDRKWLDRLPLFLEYRRICSYYFISNLWTEEKRNDSQQTYLKNMKEAIEQRIPIVAIDFQTI
ncbi:MAG: phosphotransferase enzyme family protein [Cellulosilyticaceae bacterium]